MQTIKIEVDNLKCGGCENTIKRQLEKINEVVDVKMDFDSSTVEVFYLESIDEGELRKSLERIGYPAKGTSNTIQNIKSYVSCAVGKLNS